MRPKILRTIPELYTAISHAPDRILSAGELTSALSTVLHGDLIKARESYRHLLDCVGYPTAIAIGGVPFAKIGDTAKERLLNALVLADAGLLDMFIEEEYKVTTGGIKWDQ